MGMGEPLDNFDNVMRFLEMVNAPGGVQIGMRHISLSTCGLIPKIYDLMREGPAVTLSVSLHAHSDAVRKTMMPIAERYGVAELVKAAADYAQTTGRRVIFEYALVEGVNDSRQDAAALAKLLRGILCHVNLIPLNSVKERALLGVTRARAEQFAAWLTELQTVRPWRG